MSINKLYTPEEVADILQVKRTTVNEWLRNGNLQGVKLNLHMWRVKSEDLDSFIKEGVKRA